ncbi:integrase arm-type DNA-binding domain-containing protein [uncultured Lamprocystis sp.]|jgi:integrase|uniref:tyrosine-type recombinase/integrase n=1 Tax=uncultured Lamprocystis sp. TaxID=543132 RepID=UPI0025ED3F35|nr:integrase arm-type DNA-binding domain-containing protein [uncultured Lamprocystis sp.]
MPLTDTAIRKLKPAEKQFKVADAKGLHLLVSPSGGKLWRLKYRFDGKEKLLSFGTYPDVPLIRAREKRDEARRLLADGVDPGEHRKVQKAAKVALSANSFEAIGREWFTKMKPEWVDSHADKIMARLERDVFPWLGKRPIAELTAVEVLTTLKRISDRGAKDTAKRAQQDCGGVFRYAIQTGRASYNPIPDLRGALPTAIGGNFAAITDPVKVGELLRAIDGFNGTFIVKCALRLSPFLFVRPGELRQAKWADFDLDKAEWKFLVSKTKKTEEPKIHLVPLASQAVVILRELHALTGHGEFVFPGARSNGRAMSEAAVNAALRRMGYDTKTEITGHGFRAMARTILHEVHGISPEVIEHQLAHKVPDALGSAYNRTKFLPARKAMMQLWADYLDKLKVGADVISLHGDAA